MRFALLALLLVGCSSWKVGPFAHDPEQPTAPDPWDNQDDPTWGAKAPIAARACHRWAQLGCGEAKGTRDGMSCVEMVTRNEAARPMHFTFGPECVVKQSTCEAASACAHSVP